MIDDVWDSFAEAAELLQSRRPMGRPRDRDLDACESTIGYKLPTSCNGFVKRFGAGSLRLVRSFFDFIMGYCFERYPLEWGYTATLEWKRFGDVREYHRH